MSENMWSVVHTGVLLKVVWLGCFCQLGQINSQEQKQLHSLKDRQRQRQEMANNPICRNRITREVTNTGVVLNTAHMHDLKHLLITSRRQCWNGFQTLVCETRWGGTTHLS